MAEPQRFSLQVRGARHEVEVVQHAIRRTVTWAVDDQVVATRTSGDDTLTVEPDEGHAGAGRLTLRFATLGTPRRATWYAAGDNVAVRSALGRDGIDLDPEPGSPAAAYAERLAAHPTRYTLIQTGAGVAKVVVPILLSLIAVRVAVSIPWPDLPSIPWPDLPSIPWPDLPSISWPDLPSISLPSISWPSIPWPDWHAPGWLEPVFDASKYVWPVVLAFVLARAELRRRRQQEARKAELRRELNQADESHEKSKEGEQGEPDTP